MQEINKSGRYWGYIYDCRGGGMHTVVIHPSIHFKAYRRGINRLEISEHGEPDTIGGIVKFRHRKNVNT